MKLGAIAFFHQYADSFFAILNSFGVTQQRSVSQKK
jgi:hypothetical protein